MGEIPRFHIGHRLFRGRVALAVILRALGIGKSDEVAVQGFTCTAVPEGILASGAKPIWIDVDPDQVTMSPMNLEARITPRTRAIVVQHTFGVPSDMEAICRIAAERNIQVIEDCCHTLDSRLDGRRLGTFGVAAFYSFEWGKPLIAGVGGSAVANDSGLDQDIARIVEDLALPGARDEVINRVLSRVLRLTYSPRTYWVVRDLFRHAQKLGFAHPSYHAVDAARSADFGMRMLSSTSSRLDRLLKTVEADGAARREQAQAYREALAGAVAEPGMPPGADPALARFPVLVENKPEILEKARREGVELAAWYERCIHPLSEEDARAVGYEPGDCPNAESLAQRLVSFPVNAKVNRSTILRAARVVAR